MLERTDFSKKQLVFVFSTQGEKLAFKNDNLIVKSKEGKTKYQITCYRIFILYVVGETSITTGLIRRAKNSVLLFAL
jgi:CRISPR-associated protein Cas1